MNEIIVNVTPDGAVHYEMNGFEGDTCFAAAEALLAELKKLGIGLEITAIKRKEGDERVELSTNRPVDA